MHLLAGTAPRPPSAGSTGLRKARPGRTPKTRTRVAAGRGRGVAAHHGRAAVEPAGSTARGSLPAPLRALPGAGGRSTGERHGPLGERHAGPRGRASFRQPAGNRGQVSAVGRRATAACVPAGPRHSGMGTGWRQPPPPGFHLREGGYGGGTVTRCHPLSLQVAAKSF